MVKLKRFVTYCVFEDGRYTPHETTTPLFGCYLCSFAQQQHHQAVIAPVVDGSIAPQRISDRAAIKALFASLVVSQQPTAAERTRLRARLLSIQLNETDLQRAINESLEFSKRWIPAEQAAIQLNTSLKQTPNVATRQAMVARHMEMQTMAEDTYATLLRTLSPDGAGKLERHLQKIKTQMKIIPAPKMEGVTPQ